MNQYGSAIRTYIASNVIEKAFTPPNDLALVDADVRQQFFQMGGSIINPAYPFVTGLDDWNLQANFSIRRCGLFSNFADGFVYLSPSVRPSIAIRAFPWKNGTAVPGTVSMTAGTRTLVGVGTSWATPGPGLLTVGNYYAINGHIMIVDAIASDNAASVTQYDKLISATGIPLLSTMYAVTGGGTAGYIQNMLPCIDTLNYMYEADRFEPIAQVTLTGYTHIALLAILNLHGGITLGTKSIDTAWAGAVASFDIKADLEITLGVP